MTIKVKPDDSNEFLLLGEYGMGGEIDGEKLCWGTGGKTPGDIKRIEDEHLALYKSLRLCNGFRYFSDHDPAALAHGMAGGFTAAMIELWNSAEWSRRAARRGKKPREWVDFMVDHYRQLVRKYGDRVRVNTFPEYDNDQWVRWTASRGPFADRAAAYRNLHDLFATDHEMAMLPPPDDPQAKRPPAGKPLAYYADVPEMYMRGVQERGLKYVSIYTYLRERGIRPEELNLVNLYCQTFTAHLIYALGASAAWPEGNVANNHQLTIAFVRGAARQYRRSWCYDVAPYDCFTDSLPMAYDRQGRQISGFSEEFMLRAWLISYLSGAKIFLFQSGDTCFFRRDPRGKLRLTPLGESARDFADFTLRRHPRRGRARAPVALLLASDHGYTPPLRNQAHLFGGALPEDRAHRSLEGFFRLAFPGYDDVQGTGCVDRSLWAPGGSFAAQYPWMKPELASFQQFRKAYREAIRAGFDKRSLEKPMLTVSTWGDSFDVLVDNAPLAALQDYPALILLGHIRVDDDLRRRLTAYVEAGGQVLLNAAQVTEADAGWLGVQFSGKIGIQQCHSHSRLTGRIFSEGQYRYAEVTIQPEMESLIEVGFLPANAKVPAGQNTAVDYLGATGHPLLTRRRLGKGAVWFVTVPDYLPTPEKQAITWMEACKEAVDEFIRPHLGLEVQGPPLEWLINDTPEGRVWVTLVNNSPNTWTGRVTLKERMGKVTGRDIWNEKPARFEYDEQGRVVLKPEIAPWMFVVVEIEAQKF